VGPRNHVLDGGPDPHTWMDNFDGKKGLAQDMSSSQYTQWLSREQHWYGWDADWGVLHGGARFHNLAKCKYNSTVCVWWWYGLMSNYCDHL